MNGNYSEYTIVWLSVLYGPYALEPHNSIRKGWMDWTGTVPFSQPMVTQLVNPRAFENYSVTDDPALVPFLCYQLILVNFDYAEC